MKKKILSLFLAMLMIFGSFGTFAIGAAAENSITLTVNPRVENEFIVVDVVVSNNPGIAGLRFTVDFDENLMKPATPVVLAEAFTTRYDADWNEIPGFSFTSNFQNAPATYGEFGGAFSNPANITTEGVLITLRLRPVAGTNYDGATFTIFENDSEFPLECSNQDGEVVAVNVVNGVLKKPAIDGIDNVKFENKTAVYNGDAQEMAATGLTEEMAVAYVDEKGDPMVWPKTVGTYDVAAVISHKTNPDDYAVEMFPATLTITPAEVTAADLKAVNKSFDNTTAVEITGSTKVTPVFGSDEVELNRLPTTGTVESAAAGTGKAVTIDGDALTLTGAQAPNYTLKSQPALTVNVTKFPVTVTPNADQQDKKDVVPTLAYTATEIPAEWNTTFDGALAIDGSYGTVGQYNITLGTLKLVGDNAANLEIKFTEGVKYTVLDKDPTTVEMSDAEVEKTYGDDAFTLTYNVTAGNTDGEATWSSSDETVATVDQTGKVTVVGAGTATITVKIAGDETFAEGNGTTTVKVNPLKVAIAPTVADVVYGETPVVENIDALTAVGGSVVAAKLEKLKAGEYTVDASYFDFDAKKYALEVTPVTFNVTKKEVTFSGFVVYPTAEGVAPVVNVEGSTPVVEGTVYDDVVTVTNLDVAVASVPDADKKSTITGFGISDTDNYEILVYPVVDVVVISEEDEKTKVDEALGNVTPDSTSGKKAEIDTDATTAELLDAILEVLKDAVEEVKALAEELGESYFKNVMAPKLMFNGAPVFADADTFADPDVNTAAILEAGSVEIEGTGVTLAVKKTTTGGGNTWPTGNNFAALLLYYHKKNEANQNKTPVEGVTASVATGTVKAGTTVALNSATEGATIRYTLDGTAPTALSPVYTAPIAITADTTIKAFAAKSGMTSSAPVTFTYTVDTTSIALKENAAEIKYFEGRGDNFEPDAFATRYEVVEALYNVFDIKSNNAPKALTDVSEEYKAIVDAFTAAGIIDGRGDGKFDGEAFITRAEVAKIISVMMGLDIENAKDAGFTDVKGWAVNYVNACANAKYVKGVNAEGTEYAPEANITRAQLASLINNITGAKAGTECKYSDVIADTWYFGIVAAAAK